jgi:hypothetical protein
VCLPHDWQLVPHCACCVVFAHTVSGSVDAGKSTLVAVLTHGTHDQPMLDSGRGTARMSVGSVWAGPGFRCVARAAKHELILSFFSCVGKGESAEVCHPLACACAPAGVSTQARD